MLVCMTAGVKYLNVGVKYVGMYDSQCMTPEGVKDVIMYDSCRSQVSPCMTPARVLRSQVSPCMTPAGVKYLYA